LDDVDVPAASVPVDADEDLTVRELFDRRRVGRLPDQLTDLHGQRTVRPTSQQEERCPPVSVVHSRTLGRPMERAKTR
jgi:hypothetical protein